MRSNVKLETEQNIKIQMLQSERRMNTNLACNSTKRKLGRWPNTVFCKNSAFILCGLLHSQAYRSGSSTHTWVIQAASPAPAFPGASLERHEVVPPSVGGLWLEPCRGPCREPCPVEVPCFRNWVPCDVPGMGQSSNGHTRTMRHCSHTLAYVCPPP